MTDYDIFAPFYDDIMEDRDDVITLIQQQISFHHPDAQTILELGCGTGSIIAGLSNSYTVFGLDRSINMLKIAQQKLPKSTFYQDTITDFKLSQKFDAIICVFDTINHLTTFKEWRGLLNSTHQHLNPGGLLVFDMNTIGRMQELAGLETYVKEFNGNVMEMDISRLSDTKVQWRITIQETRQDGAIQVYEEEVEEVSFPLVQVEHALRSQKYKILETLGSDNATPSDDSDRVYFVCRKSAE